MRYRVFYTLTDGRVLLKSRFINCYEFLVFNSSLKPISTPDPRWFLRCLLIHLRGASTYWLWSIFVQYINSVHIFMSRWFIQRDTTADFVFHDAAVSVRRRLITGRERGGLWKHSAHICLQTPRSDVLLFVKVVLNNLHVLKVLKHVIWIRFQLCLISFIGLHHLLVLKFEFELYI